jgi:3-mercaptopyruvate sulfurtransferase SseA
VYDTDEWPVIWTLTNILCKDIVVLDEGWVQFLIEQYQLRRCEFNTGTEHERVRQFHLGVVYLTVSAFELETSGYPHRFSA